MSEIIKIGLDDPLSIFNNVNPNRVGAFRRDTISEHVDGVWALRQRPGVVPNAPFEDTTLAGTPQGLTQFAGNTYAVVGDSFAQVNTGPTGANMTAFTADSASSGFGARQYFDMVDFNGALYIIGGQLASTGSTQGDVWISKDGGITWGMVTAQGPFGPRFGHRVVVFNGAMYVIGGWYSPANFAANDTWMTTDGVNWVQTNGGAVSFPGRAFFAAVATSGGIFVMGGTTTPSMTFGGAFTSYNDVWFSPDGINWTQIIAAAPWSVRACFDCVFFNNNLVLLGGRDPSTLVDSNECWSSPDGRNWTLLTGAALAGGAGFGSRVVAYAGKLWSFGGHLGAIDVASVYSSSNGGTAWGLVSNAMIGGGRFSGGCCVSGVSVTQNPARLSSVFYVAGGTYAGAGFQNTFNGTLNVTFASIALAPSTAGQPYQFEAFKNGSCLLIKNQSNMWVFEGGVVTKVSDKRYPSVTVPGLVVLGGFAYVMDPTGLIVNCDFNNPQYWPGQNYVGADYDADGGQCIAKMQNYLVAFGPNSIQPFYDAGTPIGSPLLPYQAGNQRFGCCDPLSVVSIDGNLFWYGQDEVGARGIASFDGLRATIISPQPENFVLQFPFASKRR
jgi:hypothetical protein